MDFITQLPKTKAGFDAIVVFVDLFSKMVHFAPMHTNAMAPDIAYIFVDTIFKIHGLPKSIISDRDAKFTSRFWRTIFNTMGTCLALSTAFHPQTDGQTERTNRTLEDMLRAFVNYKQDDWDRLLPTAEFACNNVPNASTGMSPFKVNYGRDPLNPYALIKGVPENVPAPAEFLLKLKNAEKIATDALVLAKANQEKYANQSRREVILQEGDNVLLSAKHIQLASQSMWPSKKLQNKFIGSFKVEKRISTVAYKLELPPTIWVHLVFHVSLLRAYSHPNSVDHRILMLLPPEPSTIENHTEYEVERILDVRTRRHHKEYLVKWTGYPEHDASWEPVENVANANELVKEFESASRTMQQEEGE
jgi:Chromo (CHRromatin Organisation MOdifier) domain